MVDDYMVLKNRLQELGLMKHVGFDDNFVECYIFSCDVYYMDRTAADKTSI